MLKPLCPPFAGRAVQIATYLSGPKAGLRASMSVERGGLS
jgi:hypothetical protein